MRDVKHDHYAYAAIAVMTLLREWCAWANCISAAD